MSIDPSVDNKSTLIFLPGLGADHRLFKHQTAAFSNDTANSVAVDWIEPTAAETLEGYAERLADSLPKYDNPVIVCGLSLGGMVAPYVARRIGASACIRLCTVRNYTEFPPRYYPAWLLMRAGGLPLSWIVLFAAQVGARFLLFFSFSWRRRFDPDTLRAFTETKTMTLVRLTRMMLNWAYRRRSSEEPVPADVFPAFQVHGAWDFLLPIRRTKPDVRIRGGGHLLSLTHPEEINRIIREFVDTIANEMACCPP